MTEFKKISQLDRVTSLKDTDLFIVETVTGTKAISRSDFKDEADTITKEDIGLGDVDNTSDLDKPVSTATQTELDKKVDTDSLTSILSDYLTTYDAGNTYLSQNDASGIYLSKEDAETNYIQGYVLSDYLPRAEAETTYVTQDAFNEALADLENILSEV